MGGQSLARDGTVATLDQRWLEADTAAKIYRVAAGTRWSTVIARLDALGFSPAVMQSNNDFGVASTFSVNAHGWPVPFSGCGSTVRALTMVLADGTVVTCSRTENADLFRHAMGGYGLFGVITELELDMRPNALLSPRFDEVSGPDVGARFAQQLAADATIQMAYGRMDVSLDRFFERGLLVTYRPTADQSGIPAASGSGFISRAARYLFRAQVESDRAKHFRWWTEARLGPRVSGDATRNTLMNEPVVTLDDRDPFRTDILHEYFVAPERFAEFVKACQAVIPSSYQQLLNITLRYVNTDHDSVLAYAPEPRIAAVLLFSQEKTLRGETDMAQHDAGAHRTGPGHRGHLLSAVPAARVAGAARRGAIRAHPRLRPASGHWIPICCSATNCGTTISPSSEARRSDTAFRLSRWSRQSRHRDTIDIALCSHLHECVDRWIGSWEDALLRDQPRARQGGDSFLRWKS